MAPTKRGSGILEGVLLQSQRSLVQTHPFGPGGGSLQGDDPHGQVEVQVVLALPHQLLSLELTNHVVHKVLLPPEETQGGRALGQQSEHWALGTQAWLPVSSPLSSSPFQGAPGASPLRLPKEAAKEQNCSWIWIG